MIRPAVPADQPAIEDLVQAAYLPWVATIGGRPGPLDADYAALVAAGQVYVTGDPITGVVVLEPEDGAIVVENVAVHPDRHGQGIGRRLMAFAEAEARRLARPAVRLYTHEKMTSNIALYERLGYHETGRQPIPGGHLVHLRKVVTVT